MIQKEINSFKNKRTKCIVFARVVGYLSPIDQWNEGKIEEYKDRKYFEVN